MTPTEALLGDDPLWLIIVKVVVIFVFLMVMTLFMIWMERRVVGRMQQRPGPNRVGPFGLLQSLADGLKLAFKEDIQPAMADRWVYILAPIISAITAFTAFSVIPLGGEVSIFGEHTVLQITDLQVGVLVVLACSSLGVYGIVLSGWASGSPYPLLGSLRSAAQVISYEIALGMSIVAVVLYSGSLSTADIVAAQSRQWWFVFLLFPSFAVFCVSMVGETNRAPFDLPEAESELVGGFHTEYSSLKFALFFLAEYVNMVTVSAMATTLFLGGWHAPWPISIWDGANTGWWPLLWFFLKVVVALFVFIWLRGTLPRMRYDQFMRFGWKVLVPTALVWILVVATMRTVSREANLSTGEVALYVGVPAALLVLAGLLIASRSANRDTRLMAEEASAGGVHAIAPEPDVLPAAGPGRRPTGAPLRADGGSPIPPMDLK